MHQSSTTPVIGLTYAGTLTAPDVFMAFAEGRQPELPADIRLHCGPPKFWARVDIGGVMRRLRLSVEDLFTASFGGRATTADGSLLLNYSAWVTGTTRTSGLIGVMFTSLAPVASIPRPRAMQNA